jgi:hypothetical protein
MRLFEKGGRKLAFFVVLRLSARQFTLYFGDDLVPKMILRPTTNRFQV